MVSRVKTILFKCRNFCLEFLLLPSWAPLRWTFENCKKIGLGNKMVRNKEEQNALSGVEKEPTKDPSCTPCEFDSGKTVGQITSFQPHWHMEILGAALSGSLLLESRPWRTSALFAFENWVENSKIEKGRALDKVNQVFCTGKLDRKELFHPLRLSVDLFFQPTWKPQG